MPPTQAATTFTDTAGTICEQAAAICCRTGLMAGVDARHFYPCLLYTSPAQRYQQLKEAVLNK